VSGKLAGRTERGQPVDAGLDEIVDEAPEHVGLHPSGAVDR